MTGVYRPRDPRSSPLYQCVHRHYDESVECGAIHRGVEEQVLNRFLDCGDRHKGFARIYCDACGHDYLLAFSCKTRYFCPCCHQNRILVYGDLPSAYPCPVTDGMFSESGIFRVFSAIPSQLLVEQLRHAVLDNLVEEEAITEDFAHKRLNNQQGLGKWAIP